MKRQRRTKVGPAASQLSQRARAILARTSAARAARDARIAGVELDGGPTELGQKRRVASPCLGRDITKQKEFRR